jgi:CheY-like chemotaxis protein
MIERLVGEDVALALALDAQLGKVMCDPGQIEQVLMNLVVNARDAMPTGGKLTIATGAAGAAVTLTVADTGVGMDEPTRGRIFEPFFTTKPTGKGTGLGLSMVYGIIEQSGGTITVETGPGKGTAFVMTLPEVEPAVESAPDRSAKPSTRGSETVLIVEDEPQVRGLMRKVLETEGYVVLEAIDGGDALQVSERHAGTIDLVVTDVVMPTMSGAALVERLVGARPGARVVFVSGYTHDVLDDHAVVGSNLAFLQKPLTPDALVAKVREVLDAEEGRVTVRAFCERART